MVTEPSHPQSLLCGTNYPRMKGAVVVLTNLNV